MSAAAGPYPGSMRKFLTFVCVAAGLGGAAGVVSGCGAERAVGVDVASAADATAAKETARVALTTRVQGAGLPAPIVIKATGVTALGASRGTMTFDLAPLLTLLGSAPDGAGRLELRFDAGRLWAKPPALGVLKIPGGKHWVSLDAPRVAAALGLPTKGLGALFTLEPSAQLRAMRAAKGLKEVGKEDIAGVQTTHFHGTYRLADLLTQLPADQRADARKAIDSLNRLGGGGAKLDAPVPADLWIDAKGVTRRLVSTATLPAQGGQPAGSLRQQYELSDFGAALDVTPPPVADTFDATAALSGALASVRKQTAG